MGNILLKKGEFDNAVSLFVKSVEIAHDHDFFPLTGKLYETLHESHYLAGNHKKALEYMERAVKMQEHLLNENRLRSIDELEIRYQTAEKERLLALADLENLKKSRQLTQSRWLITLLAFGLFMAISIAINFQQKRKNAQLLITQSKIRHEQQLATIQQEKDLAALRALFTGQEQERRRIANDLHDSLGGLLFSLQLKLSKSVGNPSLNAIIQRAIVENRRISENLLPPTLARFGLVSALEEYVESFQKSWNLQVHLDLDPSIGTLPEDEEISLFRISQELMNNVARHAKASLLNLQLYQDENSLILIVEDDGQGFDLENVSPTFLKTVSSRVKLLDGRYEVDSTVGRGTTVIVHIPHPVGKNYSEVSIG